MIINKFGNVLAYGENQNGELGQSKNKSKISGDLESRIYPTKGKIILKKK
jgi:hypothetical protein